MGNLSARLTRQFYRFNAENRAQKIFKSKEIRPAPKYDKTLEQINILEKEMPSLKNDLARFDPQLHDRLKKVYVTSDVTPAQSTFTKPPRLSSTVRQTSDFGFDESETSSPGRTNLRNVVQMIMTNFKEEDCKIEDLASRYKIKKEDVANILKYYQCFSLKLPREKLDVKKYLNTIMIGNELGEVLTSSQFIQRIQDQKGIRDATTRGIPPLNEDVIAWEKEEQKQRALASGRRKKSDEAQQIKSGDKE